MVNKVKMTATNEDIEKAAQDQGDFVVPPNGYYVLQLKECNPGLSKDDDGNEDPKRPRLECIWVIIGVGVEGNAVEENYGNVWDYVSFSKDAGWHRAQFLKATGVIDGTKPFEGDVDVDALIGVKVIARLAQQNGRTKDDPKKAKVRSLLAFEDADASAAFGDATEDDSGDEGDEDAPYTQEELDGMEPKELGTIAKEELQLDPSEFVVKVRGKVNVPKSKAALIEAILAAQAEGDDEGDSGEDPF